CAPIFFVLFCCASFFVSPFFSLPPRHFQSPTRLTRAIPPTSPSSCFQTPPRLRPLLPGTPKSNARCPPCQALHRASISCTSPRPRGSKLDMPRSTCSARIFSGSIQDLPPTNPHHPWRLRNPPGPAIPELEGQTNKTQAIFNPRQRLATRLQPDHGVPNKTQCSESPLPLLNAASAPSRPPPV
ncbi:hypothetical protein BGZ61DRAFT_553636, partial [Ilyonectria robusta]|uniref:uncharacterized protein n=1 Tax=Ilyonectria robusta TaxID=1079257 RepID=UPI001E8E6FA6